MEAREIYLCSLVETEHFFYRVRRDLVRYWLAQLFPDQDPRPLVIEVGAGTGILEQELGDHYDALAADLFFDPKISIKGSRLVKADAVSLPFASGIADAVAALDLIEHLADDLAGLKEMTRIARPGGYLFINVPASPLLWSDWDQAVGHQRRYTKKMMESLISAAGLETILLHYANSLPFLPILVYRWFRSNFGIGKKQRLEDRVPPKLLNLIFKWAFFQQGSKAWIDVPFGGSIFAVLRKRTGNS